MAVRGFARTFRMIYPSNALYSALRDIPPELWDKSGPAVRRILTEANVSASDLRHITPHGFHGRLTKADVLSFEGRISPETNKVSTAILSESQPSTDAGSPTASSSAIAVPGLLKQRAFSVFMTGRQRSFRQWDRAVV